MNGSGWRIGRCVDAHQFSGDPDKALWELSLLFTLSAARFSSRGIWRRLTFVSRTARAAVLMNTDDFAGNKEDAKKLLMTEDVEIANAFAILSLLQGTDRKQVPFRPTKLRHQSRCCP